MRPGGAPPEPGGDSTGQLLEGIMKDRRPARVLLTLLAVAAVCFVSAGIFDHHADWNDPRQFVANLSWIVFLLSALSAIVVGVRLAVRRGRTAA
jgi:hypothetical membrane protein